MGGSPLARMLPRLSQPKYAQSWSGQNCCWVSTVRLRPCPEVNQRRRGTGRLGRGIGRLLTSLTQWFIDEAGKGFEFFGAFTLGRSGFGRRRARGGSLSGPQHKK